MEYSDDFDTPSPPINFVLKTEEEGPPLTIPLKRKPSLEVAEDSSQILPGQADHKRAHLARKVPHVFNDNGSQSPVSPASPLPSYLSSSNIAASSSRSPSSSARPSPNPSEEESEERGGSHGLGSRGEVKSRHTVPKGFRGPLPRPHDAEDIAPMPTLTPVPGTSLFNTVNYPYNRNGYHYVTAGPASDYLPTSVYRTLETEPRGIHWSWIDRSPFTHISQNACIVSSDRGFRCARANIPVREGSWYVELHILSSETATSSGTSMKDGPHVRLGWSRREAGLNAPVGANGYSYGIRDTTGEKVFLSRTYQYGKSFGPGDVVGMYISLPPVVEASPKDPADPAKIARKRIPIRYKGRMYFETLEYPMSKEMEHLMARSRRGEKLQEGQREEAAVNVANGMLVQPQIEDAANAAAKKKRKNAPGPGPSSTLKLENNLRPLPTLGPDSQIGFFINGEPQGVAFENLLDFRPLRRQTTKGANKNASSLKVNTSSLGLGEEGANNDSIITTSSSLASILKSRENHFDDGSLGYYPFVSLFGGARVEIVSRAEAFHFPPPARVREALEKADERRGRERVGRASEERAVEPLCRPLEERYDDYLQELWEHDLADEQKAKATAHLLHANDDDDDDEDEGTVGDQQQQQQQQQQQKKSSSRKYKKKAAPSSRNESPRNSIYPSHDEHAVEIAIKSSSMNEEIKQEEAMPLVTTVVEELREMEEEEEVVVVEEDGEEEMMEESEESAAIWQKDLPVAVKEPSTPMEIDWKGVPGSEEPEPMQVDEE